MRSFWTFCDKCIQFINNRFHLYLTATCRFEFSKAATKAM
jgi:hypothetical protein